MIDERLFTLDESTDGGLGDAMNRGTGEIGKTLTGETSGSMPSLDNLEGSERLIGLVHDLKTAIIKFETTLFDVEEIMVGDEIEIDETESIENYIDQVENGEIREINNIWFIYRTFQQERLDATWAMFNKIKTGEAKYDPDGEQGTKKAVPLMINHMSQNNFTTAVANLLKVASDFMKRYMQKTGTASGAIVQHKFLPLLKQLDKQGEGSKVGENPSEDILEKAMIKQAQAICQLDIMSQIRIIFDKYQEILNRIHAEDNKISKFKKDYDSTLKKGDSTILGMQKTINRTKRNKKKTQEQIDEIVEKLEQDLNDYKAKHQKWIESKTELNEQYQEREQEKNSILRVIEKELNDKGLTVEQLKRQLKQSGFKLKEIFKHYPRLFQKETRIAKIAGGITGALIALSLIIKLFVLPALQPDNNQPAKGSEEQPTLSDINAKTAKRVYDELGKTTDDDEMNIINMGYDVQLHRTLNSSGSQSYKFSGAGLGGTVTVEFDAQGNVIKTKGEGDLSTIKTGE